jgi:hypothetical protein
MFPNGAPNPGATPSAPPNPQSPDNTEPKKKNIFQKIFGGGNKPAQPAPPASAPQ